MRRLFFSASVAALFLAGCMPAAVSASTEVATLAQAPTQGYEGRASWYGPGFAGRRTANGEIFDPSQLTAAHKTLPFGTRVRVTNLNNGRSTLVRINDRGPFKPGRIIDLSRAAAEQIGMIGSGTAPVTLELMSTNNSATLATAVDNSLQGYSVVSSRYEPGTLLLLSSSRAAEPLLVRVVGSVCPEGVDMLVSKTLHSELGDGILVLNP